MKPLTAADPETHSPDLVAENIAHLKTLFPEAFTEGKVDFEALKGPRMKNTLRPTSIVCRAAAQQRPPARGLRRSRQVTACLDTQTLRRRREKHKTAQAAASSQERLARRSRRHASESLAWREKGGRAHPVGSSVTVTDQS